MFRCKHNIKMDFKENIWDCGEWIHLAADRDKVWLF
jgi:hypothetical protein